MARMGNNAKGMPLLAGGRMLQVCGSQGAAPRGAACFFGREGGMDQASAGGRASVSAIHPAAVADARFGYQLTVTGPDLAALLAAARAAIVKLDGVIEVDAPAFIVANFGSQAALRLAGAFLTPRRKWPVKLLCQVDADGQLGLCLTSSEAFGVGTLLGVEGKFKERCQELLQEVSAEMVGQLAADSAG